MGIVFGVTGTKEPVFNVMATTSAGYKIRQYSPYFVASVPQEGNMAEGNSFRTLARYIGVFGQPENDGGRSLAMTAPVLMDAGPTSSAKKGTKLSMTSPVLTDDKVMSFVLPFEFTTIAQVPRPTDSRVSIKEVPGRVVAVDCFSGWYSDSIGQQQLAKLCDHLRSEGLLCSDENVVWTVAQYHPPFTIPFLRRNELWVELDPVKAASYAGTRKG